MSLPSLAALSLHDVQPTEGTGKRKIDGTYADTRLGQPLTLRWVNERFRQVMMLVRAFRMDWPDQSLLTADDAEFIRVALDTALASAMREGHKSDVYDLNPTTWSIWLVQHVKAVRRGAWTVETAEAQQRLSFELLYGWLDAQHRLGQRWVVRDPMTRERLHRFALPFKAQMRVPPKQEELFKWRKGARRLSDWMVQGGLAPMDPAIQSQQPAALVAPPPHQSQRATLQQALWARVGQRSRQRELASVEGGGGGDADSALTQTVVATVMSESRAITDDDMNQAFEELEQTEEEDADGGGGGDAIEVLAEYEGPVPPPNHGGGAGPSQEPSQGLQQLFHINHLLEEIREVASERGGEAGPGEAS